MRLQFKNFYPWFGVSSPMVDNLFKATSTPDSTISAIPSSQSLFGEAFIGKAVEAANLSPKFQYYTEATLMHLNGGNDGNTDYPGPLGNNVNASRAAVSLHVFLWDGGGNMIAGFTQATDGSSAVTYGLAVVNKETLEIQTTWSPPSEDETLNLAYMEYLLENNTIIVTSKEGQIYIVKISYENDEPTFDLICSINLTASAILNPGELLLNGMVDISGNIWSTTGGILAQESNSTDATVQNSTTLGYVEPCGTIHSLHIPNQVIENGIAINNEIVYVVAGPAGVNDHTDAIGYMYAFTSGPGTSVATVWKSSYSAGDGRKPGSFARGSGSTPTLLHDQYISITDNANAQVNLVIFNQNATENQTLCTVPLFQPNASNNDIGTLAHLDGDTYGVVIFNDYNAPPFYTEGDINGDFNNMTAMAGGIVRVDVKVDGSSCQVAWSTPLRSRSVPALSTESGLIYAYTQDVDLANQGIYEWYVPAIDWKTGLVAWQVRTGAGGSFSDNYLPGSLGLDGTFYQAVVDGVIMVRDGKDEC